MNSMYGKTVIRPVEVDTVVNDNKCDSENCISLNYDHIDYVLEVNQQYYVNKGSIDSFTF